MKLGVNILNFGPGTTPDSLRSWAQFAERTGFSIVMISDHAALTPDVTALYPPPFYDPFTTLAWLAGATERIELGTSVAILPYRSPLLTARMVANIDQFSRGRFVLGVGAGWSRAEFEALSVSYDQRGAISDEHLMAIRALWAADRASMSGQFVSFHDVRTGPSPVRRPHPPIWVGGSSTIAIRRAARFADAWHPIDPRLDWLRDTGIPALQRAADATGRPLPRLCPRINLELVGGDVDEADRRLGVGSLRQVRRDLDALAELGADTVVLDTYSGQPEQRRQAEADWQMLEAVAAS